MFEPIDIEIRREVAASRRATLQGSATDGPRPVPIPGLGTLLAAVGLRSTSRDSTSRGTSVRPAAHVPSGRTQAPASAGACVAKCP